LPDLAQSRAASVADHPADTSVADRLLPHVKNIPK